MTYSISRPVTERLSQLPYVHPVPCKGCHEPVIFLRGREGRIVVVDLELRKHECRGTKRPRLSLWRKQADDD